METCLSNIYVHGFAHCISTKSRWGRQKTFTVWVGNAAELSHLTANPKPRLAASSILCEFAFVCWRRTIRFTFRDSEQCICLQYLVRSLNKTRYHKENICVRSFCTFYSTTIWRTHLRIYSLKSLRWETCQVCDVQRSASPHILRDMCWGASFSAISFVMVLLYWVPWSSGYLSALIRLPYCAKGYDQLVFLSIFRCWRFFIHAKKRQAEGKGGERSVKLEIQDV